MNFLIQINDFKNNINEIIENRFKRENINEFIKDKFENFQNEINTKIKTYDRVVIKLDDLINKVNSHILNIYPKLKDNILK